MFALVLTAAFVAVANGAAVGDADFFKGHTFADLDLNGDGKITEAEHLTFNMDHGATAGELTESERLFKLTDMNGDGELDEDEWNIAQVVVQDAGNLQNDLNGYFDGHTFEDLDANGDGQITVAEHKAFNIAQGATEVQTAIADLIFGYTDENNDAVVDMNEWNDIDDIVAALK